VSPFLLQWIGQQLCTDPESWPEYAEREETRREHLLELRAYLGMESFGVAHYRQAVHASTQLALQTDKVRLYGRIGQALIDAKQSGDPGYPFVPWPAAGGVMQPSRQGYTNATGNQPP